jgi:DNA primase
MNKVVEIEIEVGIAIAIDQKGHADMFDIDPDPDIDPEKTFEALSKLDEVVKSLILTTKGTKNTKG